MVEQIRNFKDFLLLYNQISDSCFNRCANSFYTRECEPDEEKCVELCTNKFVLMNHRVMKTFMEVQAVIVQKRMEELSAGQAAMEAQKKSTEVIT
ncbi:mitochondrial import inner membrane translocase subunit Tim10 B [Copidosoma floridanum]|uniref:mitochondrial import inner membrane translocase subunit Tim10 B n=1 Tax=Copidosoma floridanum TaxID=29053 RepID=UPI0006C9A28C|nr:mitochondrial import inner membrane translocase subunit Tim10 B [Copidosoma floridanum]